jgi:two-component system chemotaxis sensor kinase CheA
LGGKCLRYIGTEGARLTGDLRDSILNIRMLPIGATFSKFRRLVRDLSTELGKEIEMTTAGEDTELDKTVIEKLNDPLVHMIRNCCDHAIGTPDVRIAKGKPRQGTIHLAAVHSGDSVYISITDDGAGLDKNVILAKAVENGLVQSGTELTEKEIFALIFAPGFSTAKEVTSVSGRGVGMDVVKRSIEELRGSIDIQSEFGKGTTITVRIPLTLAIIESLLVRIGTDHYMFPLSLVDECMFLTNDHKKQAHGRHFVQVREKVVPYIHLRKQFAVTGAPPAIEQLVITVIDGNRVGFVVDNIVGQYQTVIKSLGNAYRHVEGVSGATILGNGSVALILDVPQLYHAAVLEEIAAGA